MILIDELEKIALQKENTKAEVATYLLNYKGEYTDLKISAISQKLHTSTAVCTRLAKDLGFNGFSELKYELENASKKVKTIQKIKNSKIENYLFEVENSLKNFSRNIDYDQIILAGYILKSTDKVVLIAEEESLLHCHEFSKRLQSYNINTRIASTQTQINGQIKYINTSDVIFCLKLEPKLDRYNNLINYINQRNHKAIIVSQFELTTPKRGLFIKINNFENLNTGILLTRKLQIEALLDLIILETRKPM